MINKSHLPGNTYLKVHLKRCHNPLCGKKVNILNNYFVSFIMKETVDKNNSI